MKLSAALIVKDDTELELFKQSVASIKPFVDSWHVVANGKETAGLEAFVRSSGGDYYKITPENYPEAFTLVRDKKTYKEYLSELLNDEVPVSFIEWKKLPDVYGEFTNFSAARNFIFSKVPKDTEYIWWQDSDDILVGGEHLRECAELAKKNGKDVVYFAYWYGCRFEGKPSLETFKEVEIEHYRERLIRPGTIEWKGRLHETPVPVAGQKNNYTKFQYQEDKNPIAVMHLATLDEAYEKMNRNKKILELQLAEEREDNEADPRTLLYLMKIYTEEEDPKMWKLCLEMGEEYLTKSGWDEERSNCCDLMAICYTKLEDYDKSISFLHRAIEEYPHQPLHYVRLALAYFNKEKYRESKFWLSVVSHMDMDTKTAGVNNLKELKVLLAQLLLKIRYNVDKDLQGAVEAAEVLYKEQPLETNKENLLFLMDLLDLKTASENSKKVIDYLRDIGDKKALLGVLNSLPLPISEQPWGIKARQQISTPRIWKDNEICYFANFGGKHFEKWDGKSLLKGIGGSETAVIELSKEWVELGYKVTVYGDPEFMGEQEGVTYLPWYYFNIADKFNIFIQWRGASLARFIKSKKFLVDLHDVVSQLDYPEHIMTAVDAVLFKSQYHRNMLPKLPDSKAIVIGNGIRT